MKKEYLKPLLIIERYHFTESIAACFGFDYGKGIMVDSSTSLCIRNDGGHRYGSNSPAFEVAKQTYDGNVSFTLFNDGASMYNGGLGIPTEVGGKTVILYDGCDFDWNNVSNTVTFSNGSQIKDKQGNLVNSFANVFFNNSATSDGHTPAYNGLPLQS